MTPAFGNPPSRHAILPLLSGVTMVSGLTYIAVEPFIALYVVLIAGALGMVLALRERSSVLATRPVLAILAAIGILCVPLPFVWRSGDDLLGVVIFLPLLVAPGITLLVERDPRWLVPFALPILCLIGALAAFGGGMFEYFALGNERVGMGNNPIHFSGIAVIMGFLGLTGVAVGSSPWRFIFLLAPAAALGVCLLSGSRGPMLAWLVLAAISGLLMVVWFRRDVVFIALAVLVLAATAYAGIALDGASRALTLFDTLSAVATDEELSQSDDLRIMLYETAREQFAQAPIFGHGFGGLVEQVTPRLEAMGLEPFDNLHSDIANLAVVGGSFGLLSYALMCLAPLTLLFGRRPSRQLLLGCLVLTLGYAALGLTNAVFGMLAQTVLYGMVLGVLAAQARADDQASASNIA